MRYSNKMAIKLKNNTILILALYHPPPHLLTPHSHTHTHTKVVVCSPLTIIKAQVRIINRVSSQL